MALPRPSPPVPSAPRRMQHEPVVDLGVGKGAHRATFDVRGTYTGLKASNVTFLRQLVASSAWCFATISSTAFMLRSASSGRVSTARALAFNVLYA